MTPSLDETGAYPKAMSRMRSISLLAAGGKRRAAIRLRDLSGIGQELPFLGARRTWRFAGVYMTEPRSRFACGMSA
jgi:hypothetical protein